MHWSPVLVKYMYGIQLDDILVNGESLGLCGPNGKNQTNCLVTVDSGTSYMSAPTWAYNEFKGKIPTVDSPIDCTSTTDFGNLTFIINGRSFTFEPSEWVYPPLASLDLPPTAYDDSIETLTQEEQDKNLILLGQGDRTDGGLLASLKQKYENIMAQLKSYMTQDANQPDTTPGPIGKCTGTIMAMDLENDLFLVGDMFMRKYYSVFDR